MSDRSPGFPDAVAFPSCFEQWPGLTAPASTDHRVLEVICSCGFGITVAGPLRIRTGIPWRLYGDKLHPGIVSCN